MWTNVLEVRAIETHWTNMVYWEDLARVSRLLEVRNTLFEMWTEANEGVESVLQAGGKRLKRCSQAVATRSRIRSVSQSTSFYCVKFLSGEKVPQSRTIHSSKFMALREVSPAFPLIQPILPHTFVLPNLVYEAPSLVIVVDFVIIRAIMTVVKK